MHRHGNVIPRDFGVPQTQTITELICYTCDYYKGKPYICRKPVSYFNKKLKGRMDVHANYKRFKRFIYAGLL